MSKNVMKIISISVMGALLLTTLTACSGSKKTGTDSSKKYVFKFGHNANEENTWHKGALKFAEVVKEKSNGRIEIKIFPNEQLGKETDVITGIQSGTIDMTITGESLQNWAPKVGLVAAPYAIKDSDHLNKVAGGEIGKEIEKEIIEKTKLRPLYWMERGPRYLTSNRPIKTPEDLKGIILRVPNVPLYVKTWEALGAKPTPMAFSEVFTSLQQKTIEAQENPLALIDSASLFEVQKYINKTEHVRSWIYVVMGDKQYSSLPDDLKKVIDQAAKEAQEYEHKLFLEEEQKLAKKLQDKGMQFVETDKNAFQSKSKDAVVSSLTAEQKDLYNKIINTK
jgi:tripartite ATP-independent transporter DctP family solute receptor